MIKFLRKRVSKKTNLENVVVRKPFRPTLDRRLDKTEMFFERVQRMAERRLLAHNLKRPDAEDFHAVQLIQAISQLAAANRGKVRQPTLTL